MSRILVAEDDADLSKLVERALVARGHQVWTAPSGDLALELARSLQPELVVTDLLMPGLDGYELINELRATPETAEIPILVLSEYQGKESRLVAFRLGCDDFLPKPFEIEELCLRVEHVLRATWSATNHVKMQGRLGDLALPSVLALLETDRKTGVLDLTDGERVLRLFLEDGRVVHAEDTTEPDKPAFDVLCCALRWRSGEFYVQDDPVKVPHDFQQPTTQLLLNAFEHIDEEDASRASANVDSERPE